MDDALTRLQEQSQQLFAGLLGIRITAAEPDLQTAEIDVHCSTGTYIRVSPLRNGHLFGVMAR